MNELWKPIEGSPKYEVSNLGHIRIAAHYCIYDSGVREYHEAVPIEPKQSKDGTWFVNFNSNHLAVHRLVARAFLSEPEVPSFIQFIDGDNSNCVASNLKYESVSEIAKRNIADGARPRPPVNTGKPLMCVETGETYTSIKVLCETLGIKRYQLTDAISKGLPINGKTYQFQR